MKAQDVVCLAVTLGDGTLMKYSFVTCEYVTLVLDDGSLVDVPRWKRLATKETVDEEMERASRIQLNEQGVPVCGFGVDRVPIKGWRFLQPHEYAVFDDRELMGALVDVGPHKPLRYDLKKAKELFKERTIRPERAVMLAALDFEQSNALARQDYAAAEQALAQKQKLKDITKLVDRAKTIEGIKKVWPLNGG